MSDWNSKVIEKNPAFKEYEKKRRRTIPLVILTPSLPDPDGVAV